MSEDLNDLLGAIKLAALNDAEVNDTVLANHLKQSQLVVANLGALQAVRGDPLHTLVEALAVAQSDPLETQP